MSIVAQFAQAAKFMGWPHDFWKRMGVMEWEAWRAAIHALAQGQPGQAVDPGSWKGADRDPGWQAMRARHRAAMGR